MTWRYLARRAAQAIFVVWAAFTVSFVVLYLLPGDPIQTLSGLDPAAPIPADKLQALRHEYGYDRPLVSQYLFRLERALHGDFGRSAGSGAKVTTVIGDALPETAKLAALALVLALVGGVGLALVSCAIRHRGLQQLLLSVPALGISLPTFWVGLMLVQLVSFRWGWLPAIGNQGFETLILPAVTLALPLTAQIGQVLTKSLQHSLAEPYAETARAKGASRSRVQFRHALRNACIPALTLLGVITGEVMAGSVITETVFSRAGLGRVVQFAVGGQDIPVVQGVVVVAAVIFATVSFGVDLLYPIIDPRVRVSGSPKG